MELRLTLKVEYDVPAGLTEQDCIDAIESHFRDLGHQEVGVVPESDEYDDQPEPETIMVEVTEVESSEPVEA